MAKTTSKTKRRKVAPMRATARAAERVVAFANLAGTHLAPHVRAGSRLGAQGEAGRMKSAALPKAVKRRAKPLRAVVAAAAGAAMEFPAGGQRRFVTQPSAQPYSSHVMLLMRTGDNTRRVGTGWLIGPHTIITAGHCVYDGVLYLFCIEQSQAYPDQFARS